MFESNLSSGSEDESESDESDITEIVSDLDQEESFEAAECSNNSVIPKKRSPAQWFDFMAKIARNSGASGIGRKNKPIKEKLMGPGCSQNCRSKCQTKVTLEERKALFKKFWQLGDHTRQWDFIARSIINCEISKRRILVPRWENHRRNNTRHYILHTSRAAIRVCKTMFINTLGNTFHYYYWRFCFCLLIFKFFRYYRSMDYNY